MTDHCVPQVDSIGSKEWKSQLRLVDWIDLWIAIASNQKSARALRGLELSDWQNLEDVLKRCRANCHH
jgi:hypothetical protein